MFHLAFPLMFAHIFFKGLFQKELTEIIQRNYAWTLEARLGFENQAWLFICLMTGAIVFPSLL